MSDPLKPRRARGDVGRCRKDYRETAKTLLSQKDLFTFPIVNSCLGNTSGGISGGGSERTIKIDTGTRELWAILFRLELWARCSSYFTDWKRPPLCVAIAISPKLEAIETCSKAHSVQKLKGHEKGH